MINNLKTYDLLPIIDRVIPDIITNSESINLKIDGIDTSCNKQLPPYGMNNHIINVFVAAGVIGVWVEVDNLYILKKFDEDVLMTSSSYTDINEHEISTDKNIVSNSWENMNFINNLYLKSKEKDSEITDVRLLYNKIFDLFAKKDYASVESIIDIFVNKLFSFKLTLSFLTVTNSYKNDLTNRDKLFERAKELAIIEKLDIKEVEEVLSDF